MQGYTLDPQSGIVGERFVVVYAPRRNRDRFPENCVQLFDSRQDAMAGADPEQRKYAAVVVGPARSSEGFRLFYLLEWLEE